MSNKFIKLTIAAGVAFMFTGCATIMGSKSQKVTFTTNPQGADVLLKGTKTCKTPCTVDLVKDTYTTVTFQKDGYSSTTVDIEQGIAPIFWGNILIGGVLGSTTDSSSAAMYEYNPDAYFIDLQKK